MYEVFRLHQHQCPVVAPAILLAVSLPLCVAVSVTLAEDVQVGGGDVVGAVGPAVDVWVAYAVLLCYGVATDDGLVAVQRFPRVAVAAQGHVQTVVGIFVVYHQVGSHMCLAHFWHALARWRYGQDVSVVVVTKRFCNDTLAIACAIRQTTIRFDS